MATVGSKTVLEAQGIRCHSPQLALKSLFISVLLRYWDFDKSRIEWKQQCFFRVWGNSIFSRSCNEDLNNALPTGNGLQLSKKPEVIPQLALIAPVKLVENRRTEQKCYDQLTQLLELRTSGNSYCLLDHERGEKTSNYRELQPGEWNFELKNMEVIYETYL